MKQPFLSCILVQRLHRMPFCQCTARGHQIIVEIIVRGKSRDNTANTGDALVFT